MAGELATATTKQRTEEQHYCAGVGGVSGMDDVPPELVGLVLRHVDRLSLPVCRAVCRQWSEVLADERLPDGTALADTITEVVSEEEEDEDEEVIWRYEGRLAANGWFSVLRWAVASGCSLEMEYACAHAAQTGHLDILQWLYDLDEEQASDIEEELTRKHALMGGHLDVLEWLRQDRGCPFDDHRLYEVVAKHGQLAAAQWLHANDCPWDEGASFSAALDGHLEVLQWLRSNGCPWDERTCSNAAYGGHLELLQWARANGCPWDERTCTDAAFSGQLEVLKWARANGCPWEQATMKAARDFDRYEVVEWLSANGFPAD